MSRPGSPGQAVPGPSEEALLAVLVELDRVRASVIEQLEQRMPGPEPVPDVDSTGAERSMYEMLLDARRAVLANPAAARACQDLLVRQGRRYAATAQGAALRDRLVASEAVDHLRRIWETLSLNVLDGPAVTSGVPDAWAELIADVVAGRELDRTVLASLRPEGFA
jgi:hypothetical protein